MKTVFFTAALAALVVFSGCTETQTDPQSEEQTAYTLDEVSKHASEDDCWLLIDEKVYDVTGFTAHPGGEAILEGCGIDSTALYETRPMGSGTPHSAGAHEGLKNFYIGNLK